jgi:transcriptional regulator with XRE-family HTH domain
MGTKITPKGRFAQMFNQGIQTKGISLSDLAGKLDYSYEQLRKILLGLSSPSPLLLKELCRELGMDRATAQKAAEADRAERRCGAGGLAAMGRDPRLSALDAVAGLLTDKELAVLVSVAQGLVSARKIG